MTASRRVWLRAVALAPLFAVAATRAQDPRAGLVANAARAWLESVDRAELVTSYTSAGAKFRKAISDREWQVLYDTERKPRGALVQRAVYQTAFTTKLPGMTVEGEFASLVFRTSFSNQPDARETVTLEREGDGAWRVVGYFIR
jgi:Protein of unknown function (DUF4019)